LIPSCRWVSATLMAFIATFAFAQEFPADRAIRLIVPFPPGGGTDIFSRAVAMKLTESAKWVVVAENKPGAGGNIGMDVVAKAAPDGYTIGMGQTSDLAINPTLYSKLPYDPLKDLAPIVLIADAPVVLVVSAGSPFKSLADLVAAAKAKPGEVTFASPGNGTVSHLIGELFQSAAGIKLQHIPYKGAAQAMTDLIGGQVQSFMASVPSALVQIKGGTVRGLAVTSATRVGSLPGVPTVAESGYKGFDANTWYGLVAPARTPTNVIARINAEVNKILTMPDVREKFAAEGGGPLGGSPQDFADLLERDYAKWRKAVKDSGAKVD